MTHRSQQPSASGGGAKTPPSWKSCKAFWCISNYSTTLSRRLFMHCFQNICWLLGAKRPQTQSGLMFIDPAGRLKPQTP